MTFEEILDQAIAMLQRRGRLTYGALKRQFQLDDAYLEDLKAELIEGQRLAVDEEGRVLVWTGRADVPSLTTPPTPQLGPPPTTSDIQPMQVLPPPAAPQSPDAERRQLSVLFCDLVDSTQLSSQLDPEDYREVVRAYQATCTEVIRRYEGHVAQLLGDGLLVYFGYPQAHEDDAQRAVRTGLGILDAMGDLNQGLQQAKGIQLAIHMGIHTGLVVVGEMGGAGRQEQLALGETPNIAARIQGLAAPNTLVISDATSRLVQGYFECQDLGAQTLRGVAEPLHVYRILKESGARGRLDVAVTRGLTPLVGRESEVTLLRERWEQAKAGQGQVVLLSGEGGIGKSRLVQMLKEHVTNQPHVCWECRSFSYFENTALFPVIDLFQRLLRFQAENTPDEKLGKLEHALSQYRLPVEDTVPWFAPLLSLPVPENRYPLLNLSPQRQRQKALETIIAILLELAEHQPVLFILEDLHWTDPTTLELLNLLIDQTPTASVLVLLTCRPHFQPAWHHRSYLSEITVNRLSHAQVEQIVTGMTDVKTFPAEVVQQIIAKTDGVPLFIEEMTKTILESGQLKAVDGHYELIESLLTLAIPATLQDSLMARLDRLVTAKAVAQYAAVIGRHFAYDLLSMVSQLDDTTLQRELGRLVEAEIVYQRGLPPQATYTFKHALIQDAAYEALLKSTRQQYHQRIAQVLEQRFPDIAATQPELLAHHYSRSGNTTKAVDYLHRAGQQAVERSAYAEASSSLTAALDLLTTLPETRERSQQELGVQMTLGTVLRNTRGQAAPEVERLYTLARALCERVGELPQLFRVLWGLWGVYTQRGEYQMTRELGEQLLSLAQRLQDPDLLLEAHHALWASLFFGGELAAARPHLEQGMRLYDPQRHRTHAVLYSGHDPGVCCRHLTALSLWLLGYPDQAVASVQAALALAQQLAHPFSLTLCLHWAAILHHLRREAPLTQARAEAAMTIATDQEFSHQFAQAMPLRGWALATSGHGEEGLTQLQQGLAAYRATGATMLRPYYLALFAEASAPVGQTTEGLEALAEALATRAKSSARWWEAEMHRLRGELLLLRAAKSHPAPGSQDQHEAETCFQHALDVSRQQQAKSLELRAAMSLGRLWQHQGKRQEAYDLLTPIYAWFTEGFDTADLQEAKALLDALA
jgi:predicted ATPase/class 3 adenylate cyclase